MATGGTDEKQVLEGFLCSVCSTILTDPRALLCGHSFCGPPKNCLTNLCNEEGNVKCAICNTQHDKKVDELKPLFGIRDAIDEYSKLSSSDKPVTAKSSKYDGPVLPPCLKHPKMLCYHWCTNCREAVCDDCVDAEHEDCHLKLMKHVLKPLVREAIEMLPYVENRATDINLNIKILEIILKRSQSVVEQQQNELEQVKFLSLANSVLKVDLEDLKKIGNGEMTDIDFSVVSQLLRVLKKEKPKLLLIDRMHDFNFLVDFKSLSDGSAVHTNEMVFQFRKFRLLCCYPYPNIETRVIYEDVDTQTCGKIHYHLTVHNWSSDQKSKRMHKPVACHKGSPFNYITNEKIPRRHSSTNWEALIGWSEVEEHRGDWLKNGQLCFLVQVYFD